MREQTKVLVSVEGQTEEAFVKKVLTGHFEPLGISLVPIIVKTKRLRSGKAVKGGIVSYAKVKKDILRLLGDSKAALVTTMFDYYGLPSDFPGLDRKEKAAGMAPQEQVEFLEKSLAEDIGHRRFLPFLMLHEFEALVLAAFQVTPRQALAAVLPGATSQVEAVLSDIGPLAPEDVDGGEKTHPAARIAQHLPKYRKRLHGPLLLQRIDLGAIRDKCPHFHSWLERLEALAQRRV